MEIKFTLPKLPQNWFLYLWLTVLSVLMFLCSDGCPVLLPEPKPKTVEQLVAAVPEEYRSSVQNAVERYRNNKDIDEFNDRTVAARMKEPEPAQTVHKIRNALVETADDRPQTAADASVEPTADEPDGVNPVTEKEPTADASVEAVRRRGLFRRK